MEPIYDLLDICEVTILDTETIYKPIGAPPDAYLTHQLNISQRGAWLFHLALRRPGKAQTKGDV